MLSGYWRSGPGVSRWEFTDRGEVIHILGGELIVEPDGEGPTTLIAGDSAVFPIGWKGNVASLMTAMWSGNARRCG